MDRMLRVWSLDIGGDLHVPDHASLLAQRTMLTNLSIRKAIHDIDVFAR